MIMQKLYNDLIEKIKKEIPKDEFEKIMNQYMCEYEYDFLGFLEVYYAASIFVPKSRKIIDFGCYLAAQSYFFKDHIEYIGVDVVGLERFKTENSRHYVCSIQDFIKNNPETLNDDSIFAICSYVPDFEATDLVKKSYKNCLVYYPN